MRKAFFLIAFLLFCVDRLSKAYVVSHLPMSWGGEEFPYGGIALFHNICGVSFSINQVRNLGAAWGIFSSFPYLLIAARIAIICAVALYALFFNKKRGQTFPFALIILGALGNIIDFFVYGGVVDMLHFTFGKASFPVFNLADTMIFCGMATLVIQSRRKKTDAKQRTTS